MTYTKSDLQSLLERLERAERPDRHLDADILVAFGIITPKPDAGGYLQKYRRPFPKGESGDGWEVCLLPDWKWPTTVFEVEPITASLDAAIALVEKALPNCLRHFGRDWAQQGDRCYAIIQLDGATWSTGQQRAGTEPLALLTAMIKALIAECEE